jgi:hypothetical protein
MCKYAKSLLPQDHVMCEGFLAFEQCSSCCSPELLGDAAVTLLLNLMLFGGSWSARAFSKLGRETPRVSFTPPAATAALPQSLRSKAFSRRPSLLTNSILGVWMGA